MLSAAAAIAQNVRTHTLRLRRLLLGAAAGAVVVGVLFGVVAGGPADPAARLERARDLVLAHKPEKAMREVRRALAELGDDGPADLRLHALVRAAQVSDFQFGDSRIHEALGYYRDILTTFPGTPEAFDAGVRVAEILQKQGDDARAEEQFVQVVDRFPKQKGVERLLFRAARLAVENRRYAAAKSEAQRLLDTWPESELAPDAQSLLGTALHLEGKHAEATAAFVKVAETWPATVVAARALFEAGNCLSEQGDYGHAIARYIESLPEHPDPLTVQRALERVRRRFSAQRAIETTGSKAVAMGRWESAR